MKPTQEQLNDPKWWDDNAPEGAEAWVDDCFFKWDEGKEYIFTDSGWETEGESWTPRDYKNDHGFFVVERPTKPAFVPKVGEWCLSYGGAKMMLVGLSSSDHYVFEIDNGGLTMLGSIDGFRPIKSKRELFVEAGVKANRNLGIGATQEEMFEALYDAGCRFMETDK